MIISVKLYFEIDGHLKNDDVRTLSLGIGDELTDEIIAMNDKSPILVYCGDKSKTDLETKILKRSDVEQRFIRKKPKPKPKQNSERHIFDSVFKDLENKVNKK